MKNMMEGYGLKAYQKKEALLVLAYLLNKKKLKRGIKNG